MVRGGAAAPPSKRRMIELASRTVGDEIPIVEMPERIRQAPDQRHGIVRTEVVEPRLAPVGHEYPDTHEAHAAVAGASAQKRTRPSAGASPRPGLRAPVSRVSASTARTPVDARSIHSTAISPESVRTILAGSSRP